MSRCQQVSRPLVRSIRQSQTPSICSLPVRTFSSTPAAKDEGLATASSGESRPPPQPIKATDADWDRRKLDPNTTTLRWAEKKLMKHGTPPVGSRRRRAAIRTSPNIPFEQLPYQAFQEARKILAEDREEKLAMIQAQTAKIAKLETTDAATFRSGEYHKEKRLASLRRNVEELKILADINDPLVKRRFEDGMGDMSKPIYRYLAKRRWEAMDKKITEQRISQFHIVPDVLPKFSPTMDVKLYFRSVKTAPGEKLASHITQVAPTLRMQSFDKEDRLLSVIVMDSDVPLPEEDAFGRRCHFLAANIPWGPSHTSLPLSKIGGGPNGGPDHASGAVAVPYLPAFSQKGSPYHRLSIFVLEQADNAPLDVAALQELYAGRDGFSLKSFRDKFGLKPVGFTLFRTEWDDTTAEVMAKHSIPGADVEFKRQKWESLKPPRKARGWEAKRQKPKYRFLWKYTKRIA